MELEYRMPGHKQGAPIFPPPDVPEIRLPIRDRPPMQCYDISETLKQMKGEVNVPVEGGLFGETRSLNWDERHADYVHR